MRQTIRDVGDRAGVSVATVSNVLNAPHLVAAQTRSKVLEAIEELGYRPNRAARSLQARKTLSIGYRMPDPGPGTALDVFLHQLVGTATDHGFAITLFAPRAGQADLDAYREMIRSGDVDGFVLSETNYDDPRVAMLSEVGVPFATFGRADHESPFPWVDVDGASGTAQVVEHLVGLGHRHIGLVAWPSGSESGDTRVKGFFDGMAAAGLEVDPQFVVRTENGFDKGRVAGTAILTSVNPPTAIVTVQDELGFGIMTAATELGLKPGRDLAVSGFDDTAAAAFMWPALTSVRQPLEEVARVLVDLMVHRLSNPAEPPRTSFLHPQLIARESTLGTST